jgi:hypothetical protein
MLAQLHKGKAILTLTALLAAAPSLLAQKAELRSAPAAVFPGATDCNSPAHWKDGNIYLFNSARWPVRSEGPDQFHLGHVVAPAFDHYNLDSRWIESTWLDEDGTLFAWYHHEPRGLCPGTTLTAPRIGALRSRDNGWSFEDLGVVLDAPGPIHCEAKNGYFAGGNGDFSVLLDATKTYFYFFFGNYSGDVSSQGVAAARMAFKDRHHPVGKVFKYHEGAWNEPGLGGKLTPFFTTKVSWMEENTDSFWGPSIHWNTYLEKYVILLNRSCCKTGWPQEGVYVTFNSRLDDPRGWSAPVKIWDGPGKGFHGSGWYPQVLGLDAARQETDKLAGKVARFYVGGRSEWEIVFSKE